MPHAVHLDAAARPPVVDQDAASLAELIMSWAIEGGVQRRGDLSWAIGGDAQWQGRSGEAHTASRRLFKLLVDLATCLGLHC
jgi:hypothetical protein